MSKITNEQGIEIVLNRTPEDYKRLPLAKPAQEDMPVAARHLAGRPTSQSKSLMFSSAAACLM